MAISRFNVVINSVLMIRKCYIQTKLDGVENDYDRGMQKESRISCYDSRNSDY